MTDLERVKEWLATFPGHDILTDMHVDYTDHIPDNGGVFPAGLVELRKRTDVLGNVTLYNQRNFAIYYVLEKSPGDDVGALINASWVEDFQDWVQEQAARGLVPKLGDRTTAASAQNGILYDADAEGVATYAVQLSITFQKEIEVK